MAFKFFKKKEENFPAEEKAEILKGEEDFPELPPLPEFKEGFRSPEELRPHFEQKLPELPKPPILPAPQQPPMPQPEPLQMPKPKPMGVEISRMPSEFGPVPKIKGAPHIYIRIDKYKDVIKAIQDIGKQIKATKEDLEEIHEISESERDKIKEAAEVLLKIEKLLSYLDKTFTSLEE